LSAVKYVSDFFLSLLCCEAGNELTFITFMLQLNNLELAVSLAKRGNLPGAEKLVCQFCVDNLVMFATILLLLSFT
jgi:hypothetical protein